MEKEVFEYLSIATFNATNYNRCKTTADVSTVLAVLEVIAVTVIPIKVNNPNFDFGSNDTCDTNLY